MSAIEALRLEFGGVSISYRIAERRGHTSEAHGSLGAPSFHIKSDVVAILFGESDDDDGNPMARSAAYGRFCRTVLLLPYV